MDNYDFHFSDTSSINIDLIRAVSAQLITISHGLEGYLSVYTFHSPGASGLSFLFLISGILISHSVLRRRKDESYGFEEFFINRFSRIYSSYLLILVLVIFIDGYHFLIITENPPINYNIPTFLCNLLLLNDSALGCPFFGTSGQFWTLPLFWWIYMIFGWAVLGKKTTDKNFVYIIIFSLFSFLFLIVVFGYHFQKKITCIIIWILGAVYLLCLNKLNNYFQKVRNDINKKANTDILKKRISLICLFFSLVLFILAIIRLNDHQNAFAIDYSVLLGSSFCLFLTFSEFSKFKYPKIIKKIIRFMASYSFTLYLLHAAVFSFYKIFINEMNNFLLFLLVYFVINIISIFIASFSEMQTSTIKNWFRKKNLIIKGKK